jgi:dihydrofolate reductase
MGRKTYEVGTKIGLTNPYPTMKQYLFSRSMKESPDEQVTLVSSDAVEMVKRLKEESGKDIWLCGGSGLAATLAPEIDEFIIKLNPVIIGSGIPLFSGPIALLNLVLADSKVYSNGFMRLHYRVRRI